MPSPLNEAFAAIDEEVSLVLDQVVSELGGNRYTFISELVHIVASYIGENESIGPSEELRGDSGPLAIQMHAMALVFFEKKILARIVAATDDAGKQGIALRRLVHDTFAPQLILASKADMRRRASE